MAIINSEVSKIDKSPEEVFKFFMNLNNLEKLMPQDKISEWESDENFCKFKVKNMGKIGFKHNTSTEFSNINLKSLADKPFGFVMDVNINDCGDNSCEVAIQVDVAVNKFMLMMVEKPLTSFFSEIVTNLKSA